MDEDGERGSSRREFGDARRGLRAAIHDTQGEHRVLATLRSRSDRSEVRVAWYRERGRRPVLSVWLYHRNGDGMLHPDRQRGLRFFMDELPELARGIARALEEAERWAARSRC